MIAVVLVGGAGTRLRPLTLDRPKPMLPIAGRPFLAHLLDRLAAAGVSRVIFSCGYLPDAIVATFGHGLPGGPVLEYVVEDEPLGTAGAIRFAAAGRVEEPFLALNGDVLAAADLGVLRRLHADRGARATLTLTAVDDPTRYGLVLRDADDAVSAFLEKPTHEEAGSAPYWINAGMYLLDPSVLELVPAGRAVSIEREVFPQLVGDGLYGWGAEGYWNDIGTPESYVAANCDVLAGALGGEPLADRHAGVELGAGVELLPPYHLGEGVHIEAGAHVGPRTAVGAGARIGAGARVAGSVVHEGAAVDAGAQVDGAVVGVGAHVGAGAVVRDHAVLGAGVGVPAGTVVAGERIFPEGTDA